MTPYRNAFVISSVLYVIMTEEIPPLCLCLFSFGNLDQGIGRTQDETRNQVEVFLTDSGLKFELTYHRRDHDLLFCHGKFLAWKNKTTWICSKMQATKIIISVPTSLESSGMFQILSFYRHFYLFLSFYFITCGILSGLVKLTNISRRTKFV